MYFTHNYRGYSSLILLCKKTNLASFPLYGSYALSSNMPFSRKQAIEVTSKLFVSIR